MNLEARLAALEERHRERELANEPRRFQHADHDAEGHVVACEQLIFPHPKDTPGIHELGPMVAGFRAMRREPFNRETCPYTDCEKRETCRADGTLTSWGRRANSPNS